MDKLKGIDLKYLFLSYEGRIGRRDFWTAVVVMLAVAVAMSIISSMLAMIFAPLAYVISIASLVTIYPACAAYAKRWHDRGKSGWWTLVALVPLAGPLYMIWELGFQPSIEETNNWGDKPVPAAI